jgi:ankyrin repeat protein
LANCSNDELDVVRFLVLEAKVDPSQANAQTGSTPLMYACGRGCMQVVRFLVEEVNVDPNHVLSHFIRGM